MEATVTREFVSRQDGQLSLNIGDVVREVVEFEDGQCFGRINDRYGLFDRTFVRLRGPVLASPPIRLSVMDRLADDGSDTPRRPVTGVESNSRRSSPHTSSQAGNAGNTEGRDSASLSGQLEESVPAVNQPVPPPVVGSPERAQVIVPYNAIDGDEVSVQVGDEVEVISRTTEDEGWWQVRVQHNRQVGVLPAIFLEVGTGPSQAASASLANEGHSSWITLNVPTDTVATPVSEPVPLNSHDQAALPDTLTEETQSTFIFQDECIGRALQLSRRVQQSVDSIAQQHGVTVQIDPSRATISGSALGVAYVQNVISTLTSQLRRHITAHCTIIPILVSAQARAILHAVQQRYGVDVSLLDVHGQFHIARAFSDEYRMQHLLQKVQVKDYLIPKEPAHMFCTWAYMDNSVLTPLQPEIVNQNLSSCYCQNVIGQEIFQLNGISYLADLSAMSLTDTASGETVSLHMVPQSITWQHSLDQSNLHFVNYSTDDSSSLETMYRYGGAEITLSGNEHLVDFLTMSAANLDAGIATCIRRLPAAQSNQLPDYNCQLILSGPPETLGEAAQEVVHQIESFCVSACLTLSLSGISQHWQRNIAVISLQILRQYCITVVGFQVLDEVLTVQLRGGRDYVELVMVRARERLLDLKDSIMTQESQSRVQTATTLNLPAEWEPQSSDVEFKSVGWNTPEWSSIETIMHGTLPAARILRIERIQNSQLFEKYELEKIHMSRRNHGIINEVQLFHGTRRNDPYSVARSPRGIDFRCCRRDHQLLWGTGVYFAVNAIYSDRYCYETDGVRKLIVAKVLTGHSKRYSAPVRDLTRPPLLHHGSNLHYDTVNASSGGSEIYVVYDHDKSYPAYIVSYAIA